MCAHENIDVSSAAADQEACTPRTGRDKSAVLDVIGKVRTISEGTIIAIASGAAYLITYRYQRSYLSFFGVPESFVQVSISEVIRTLLLLGAAAYAIYITTYYLYLAWHSWSTRSSEPAASVVAAIAMAIQAMVMINIARHRISLLGTAVIGAMVFVVVVGVRNIRRAVEGPGLSTLGYLYLGLLPMVAVSCSLLAIDEFAKKQAESQTEFPCIIADDGSPKYAILREQGGHFLSVAVMQDEITSYRVVKLVSSTDPEIRIARATLSRDTFARKKPDMSAEPAGNSP